MTGTYGAKHKRLTSKKLCYEFKFSRWKIIIIFQRENLNYLISLYHSVYLVFSTRLFSIANMFAVRYLWKMYVMEHRNK